MTMNKARKETEAKNEVRKRVLKKKEIEKKDARFVCPCFGGPEERIGKLAIEPLPFFWAW